MKKILADQIENGHISAREVCGQSGNILLSKGLPLTPAIGRRLKNWGITHVYIEGEEELPVQKPLEIISPEELKNQMMEKFSDTLNNPLMKKIFAAVYQHRLREH